MGQHMHHLVMGAGQHQLKKLCIWGLCMVIPFLVLFCIFPSGSSVYRPPNDRIVVGQLQVPPLHASRSDLTTRSSDEAFDPESEEEPSTSIMDEPGSEPKKAKRDRGGKKLRKQTAVIKQEMVSPNSSSSKRESSVKSEEEIRASDKKIGADEEDPASPKSSRSKKKGFTKSAEFNATAAGDAVFFPDMEKTDDSMANAEAKADGKRKSAEFNATAAGDAVFFPDLEKTDDAMANAEAKADDKGSISVENDGGEEDLVGKEDRVGAERFFTRQSEKCRYHEGKWIIDSTKPYEESTCNFMSIDDQQICAFERNKTEPLRWRWQPSECKVEHFNAETFLKMMQRKSLAFVGDKLAKAQMESLLCLLAEVEKPNLIYEDKTNKSSAWHFSSSNLTISMIWSPHLVQEVYENGYKKLHLDKLDTTWATMVPTVDVLILGVGSRFIEPAIYAVHKEVVGCSSCKDLIGQNDFGKMQKMSLYSGFRATMRSALMGVGALPGFEGITLFLQPYGFEGNGSYHFVSKKMKDIQEEELYHAYKRGSISNQSKMEVIHTDFISMSKNNNTQGPATSTCLVPSPLASTWNEFLQDTLTHLLVS